MQGGGRGFESRILHENTTLLATGGASLLVYSGRWASHMQGERTPRKEQQRQRHFHTEDPRPPQQSLDHRRGVKKPVGHAGDVSV